MAKGKKKRSLGESMSSSLAAVEQQAVQVAIEAATEQALTEASKAKKHVALAAKGIAGAEAIYNAAKNKQSRIHVASVDMGGQLTGVLSFEGINWVLRRIGEWSPAFAENIDIYQSLPHLVIGMIVYWVELSTRKPDASGSKIFPSMPREIASEWAKAFSLLGASNLWRALRVRRKDAKAKVAELDSVKAELAALQVELAKLRKS